MQLGRWLGYLFTGMFPSNQSTCHGNRKVLAGLVLNTLAIALCK